MPPKKSAPAPAQRSLPAPEPESRTTTSATSTGRKKWIPKTPIEVVLEQITRQEDRVGKLREELTREERELQKLQQAKKVLEST
jgi:hypothetical protein